MKDNIDNGESIDNEDYIDTKEEPFSTRNWNQINEAI
jgi:hypothetical protein